MIHYGTWLTVREKLTSEQKKKLNDVKNVEPESLSAWTATMKEQMRRSSRAHQGRYARGTTYGRE